MSKLLSWFGKFIKEYNIAGMAVAFVIGLKVSALVTSLVEDVLMPALLQPALTRAGVENIGQLRTESWVLYGQFLVALIDFLIVAFVMYLFVIYLVEKFMPAEKKDK